LVIRVVLGEEELLQEMPALKMNGEEILIAVLAQLFEEWRPEPDEVDDLFTMTGAVAAEAAEQADLVPSSQDACAFFAGRWPPGQPEAGEALS